MGRYRSTGVEVSSGRKVEDRAHDALGAMTPFITGRMEETVGMVHLL